MINEGDLVVACYDKYALPCCVNIKSDDRITEVSALGGKVCARTFPMTKENEKGLCCKLTDGESARCFSKVDDSREYLLYGTAQAVTYQLEFEYFPKYFVLAFSVDDLGMISFDDITINSASDPASISAPSGIALGTNVGSGWDDAVSMAIGSNHVDFEGPYPGWDAADQRDAIAASGMPWLDPTEYYYTVFSLDGFIEYSGYSGDEIRPYTNVNLNIGLAASGNGSVYIRHFGNATESFIESNNLREDARWIL